MNQIKVRLFDVADFITELKAAKGDIRGNVVRVVTLYRYATAQWGITKLIVSASFVNLAGHIVFAEIKAAETVYNQFDQKELDKAKKIEGEIAQAITELGLERRSGQFVTEE